MKIYLRFNNSPFGSVAKGRSFSSAAYRYGFNGQEKDNEVSGEGNMTSATFWEYDTRLGRRWNRDPKPAATESPYSCFSNSPLWRNDVYGDTTYIYTTKGVYKGVILDKLKTNEVVLMTDLMANTMLNLQAGGKYSEDVVATVTRDPKFASARFTGNTIKELTKFSTKSGQENSGLLYADKNTKEVKFDVAEKKLSDKPIIGGEADPKELAVSEKSTSKKGTILGYWHSHPENTLYGSQPSGPDFSGGGYVNALQNGGVGVIVTKGKVTIFPLSDSKGNTPQTPDRPKNTNLFGKDNHQAVFDKKASPQYVK